MKKYILLFVTFLNISLVSFSQLKVVDSISGNPIQLVSILMKNGILLGITDDDGKFNFSGITNETMLNDTTQISFSHISYENYSCRFKDLYLKNILHLVPKNIYLPPIEIKSNSLKHEYLVLYGYYRSYVYNDKKIFGFADGLIEYYIPLNGGAKIGKNYLANRLYKTKAEKDIKQKGPVKAGIDENPGVPFIVKKNILEQISIPFEKNIMNESETLLIDKNKNEIGSINYDKKNNTNRISIDLLKIDTNTSIKILGINVKFIIQNITETYQSDNLINNKEDLISFRSRYKSDYFYKNVANGDDRIQEFIVFEKRYISKKEFNELNNNSHFSYRSSSPASFNTDMIEESFTKYNITDVPINIKNQFNKTLLYK
jgi:hypothetical protein